MVIEKRHIPNILTFTRLLLVLPIVWCLFFDYFRQALLLFFIAGVSDGVDGYLARKYNWKSRLGAIVDPLADKFLLVATFITLTIIGEIPWILAGIVLGRDLVIVIGALIYHYKFGRYKISPSRLGKLSTLLQITYVLSLVVSLTGQPMPEDVAIWGGWIVGVVTLISGLHYITYWGAKAAQNIRARQESQ
ncbi:MAG: CDP-alcohol phosphatidyltransferase family protein [Hahellaceae bacterium]|nr:CDP-alcohol phosphatidyltransferase family protein [Hahellaceae bacterium]MCP5213211.1 CDP-alcohol phosphatidyltransferase family protein [Hahellaceae bacterium]